MPYAPPPPPPPAACALTRLAACGNTNQLVVSAGFAAAVRRFVGPGRASWFYGDGSIAKQVVEGLHGPPDDAVPLAADLLRFSACRAHSCPEKAAAFIGRDGRLRALAVLDFRCQVSCEDDYSLEVIAPPAEAARFTALAQAWAQAADDADAKAYGQTEPRIVRTALHPSAGR